MLGDWERIPSGCAISGIINTRGERFSGEQIMASLRVMHDRSNGLGGGFAGYGIYPDYPDHYAFHLIYESASSREQTEEFIKKNFIVDQMEPIPVCYLETIPDPPLFYRYFLRVPQERLTVNGFSQDERDYVVDKVIHINHLIDGAYVTSSGKNMGVFKGVAYPEDIARFFRLEEYEGYLWTGHGRFPTNTPGWWGGAHPFTILDWSVVHNGEISSYGINKRYLESFGYRCTLQTDTEVVAYLFDLWQRRHGLPFHLVCKALTAPFWKDIDRMEEEERKIYTALRQVYGSGMLNGPFSIIIGYPKGMVGLNDRIKLRPMVCATKGEYVYISSEESAIWEVCDAPERVWMPKAGEPVIAELVEEVSA